MSIWSSRTTDSNGKLSLQNFNHMRLLQIACAIIDVPPSYICVYKFFMHNRLACNDGLAQNKNKKYIINSIQQH